ncbi:MAG: Crp/Fnr family transcriptional regulator, partial [Acidimicrobiia bacterium]
SANERSHAAGYRIFKFGDPGTEMVVVVEGTLAAVFETDDGRQTFAEYGPGEQVGELALLRGAPRASDVIAVTDVRVLSISADVVDALLAERPDVSRAILASLANRLAAVTDASHHHDAASREDV